MWKKSVFTATCGNGRIKNQIPGPQDQPQIIRPPKKAVNFFGHISGGIIPEGGAPPPPETGN